MPSKPFLAATFVLASALAPVLAGAAPISGAMETKVATVRISDDARISAAVNRACGTATGSISLEERGAITLCRAEAQNSALALAKSREERVLAQS